MVKLLILSLMTAWLAVAQAAEISVRLSRNPVALNESFQVQFEALGSVDGEPDFSPLERDFEILSQSKSQNVSIVNGDFSRTSNWTLALMAKREGLLEIPRVSFGKDNSPAAQVRIEETAPPGNSRQGDRVFLQVDASPKRVWSGQQILLEVRLYRSVALQNASLSLPETDDPDARIEPLGEDRQYETRIDGRSYRVTERSYAIFPKRVGPLSIQPISFTGEIRQPRTGGFFDPPYGLFGRPGEATRLRSSALRIEVLAPKQGVSPWLPTNNLQISESWSEESPRFTVGEPVTRTLMVLADGLAASQLPPLAQNEVEGVKSYPDQPVLHNQITASGLIATREEKIALVPTRPGRLRLPEVRVSWWNVDTQQVEVARLPERVVDVLPAADAGPEHAAATTQRQDNQPSPLLADKPPASVPVQPERSPLFWDWLHGVLLALWSMTLLLWWWSLRRSRSPDALPAADAAVPVAQRKAMAAIKVACERRDAKACEQALLAWARSRDGAEPQLSLGEMARVSGEDLALQLRLLEQALYGQDAGDWDADALWRTLVATARGSGLHTRQPDAVLAPLQP